MQIAYCFIQDYPNIENQGINFGSPYIFHTQVTEKGLAVTLTNNQDYVPTLFRRRNNSIDNISALVGENGSGKTNILNFLVNSLSQQPYVANGFVIFVDEQNIIHLLNHGLKPLIVDFAYTIINWVDDCAVMYYNPIYDFQQHHWSDDDNFFNVSSSALIQEDFYDDQYFSDSLNPFEYHRLKNSSRQVRFIVSQKYSRMITQYINLPREIKVVLIKPKVSHKGEDFDNVSVNFRPFFTLGVDIWREEKENNRTQLERGAKRNLSVARREILLEVQFTLWKYIFYIQEQYNTTLFEGKLKTFEDNEVDELRSLAFEDYFKSFLNDQNIFDATVILNFIDVLKEVLLRSKPTNEHDNAYVSFQCSLNQIENLLDAYDPMVDSLSKLIYNDSPNGLLQFKWRNMSSGERALLDLFARIYHGKRLLNDRIFNQDIEKYPRYFYVFIDEGEIGFHLQWQKQYVETLVDILPRILGLRGYKCKIQVIFATHSPISLSDIPRYNTVYLCKDNDHKLKVVNEKESPKYSFGANVHDIMYDAFYLKDGFIGNFSKSVINEVFKWGSNPKEIQLSRVYLRKVINLVDEPILRIKLEEIYAENFQYDVEQEVLKTKIKLMQKRIDEIESKR